MTTYPVDDLAGTERDAMEGLSGMSWLWLATGVLWIVASLVVLQFDDASITTVGVFIGVMFLFAVRRLHRLLA